jgi:hypothetical protein
MKCGKQVAAAALLAGIAGLLASPHEAQAGWGWRRAAARPVVVTQRVVVPGPAAYYAPAPVTAYYAPGPVARAAYYVPYGAPVTSYYGSTAYIAPAPAPVGVHVALCAALNLLRQWWGKIRPSSASSV